MTVILLKLALVPLVVLAVCGLVAIWPDRRGR